MGIELIYAEEYILENFVISYIILSCVSSMLRMHTKIRKKLMGAAIGLVYSFAYLYPQFNMLYTIPLKILVIFFIVCISFDYKDLREYIKILLIFYLVNIFISGSTFFIIYFTGISHITISFVIASTFASSKILGVIYSDIKTIKKFNELKKSVNIVIKEQHYAFDALLDSGNLLKDPISKEDVIIINAKKLKGILCEKLLNYDYKNIDISKIDNIISDFDDSISSRVRLIPCKVVGRDNGMIIGIKADYLEFENRKISNIIVGLTSLEEHDDYDAILNPNVLIF